MGETGLLDFLKSPEGQGLLAAGFGAAAGRGTRMQAIGQGGLAGLLAYGRAGEMQADQARQKAQDERADTMFGWQKNAYQQQQDALAKAQAQQAAQQNYLGSIGQVTSPRVDAQPNQFDPIKWRALGGSLDEAGKIGEIYNPKPMSVKEGETLIDPRTHEPVFSAPGSSDAKIKQYEYAKANGYTGSFDQFVTLGPALMAAASAPLRQAQTEATTAATGYNFPKPAQRASSPVTVTAPDGRVFSFPNQQAANSFKAKAGIK